VGKVDAGHRSLPLQNIHHPRRTMDALSAELTTVAAGLRVNTTSNSKVYVLIILFMPFTLNPASGRYHLAIVRSIDHLWPRNKICLAVWPYHPWFVRDFSHITSSRTSWTKINVLHVLIRYYALSYLLITVYGIYKAFLVYSTLQPSNAQMQHQPTQIYL
jgi:hypothetical protein